jgi:hypothetical protein
MSETTATRTPRQRQPKQRTCRLTQTSGGAALVIRQRQGNQAEQVDAYFIEPVVCQLGGRGLILHKHDGTSYSVRIDGNDSECDCKGFTRFGHCKHVESLLALQQRGKL